ncbi:MAG: site-2 protease family protein, partial [Candidatus Dormibacteraceae bacterium]
VVLWVLGGPLANLLLAVILGLAMRVLLTMGFLPDYSDLALPPLAYLANLLYALYFLNLSIFAFQLLPIPGLDGWRILEALFGSYNPRFFYQAASHVQTIWMVCILIVLAGSWVGLDVLGTAVGIFFNPASTAIVGQCGGYTALHPCLLRRGF